MNAPFDDVELSAWLDGELTPERRAMIEAWLHEHPIDAAQVRLWAADREALRSQLDGVLAEPVPERLAAVVTRRRFDFEGRRGLALAAGLGMFLVGGIVGAGLVWQHRPEIGIAASGIAQPNAWVQRAAMAHSVYVPEVRHAVEVKAQEEHLSRWLTRRLNVPVKLFDLRDQGFELVGGRLLPDAVGPSAQLMYQAIVPAPAASANGAKPARVTVYLRKPDSDTAAAFRYEQQGVLGLFYWVEGDSVQGAATGYALVGELPRERLLALAEAIHRQGTSPP